MVRKMISLMIFAVILCISASIIWREPDTGRITDITMSSSNPAQFYFYVNGARVPVSAITAGQHDIGDEVTVLIPVNARHPQWWILDPLFTILTCISASGMLLVIALLMMDARRLYECKN